MTEMDRADQLVAFLVGLTPRATQRAYLDLTQVDPQAGRDRPRAWPAIFAAAWWRRRSSRSCWVDPRSGRRPGISSSTPIGRSSARDGSRAGIVTPGNGSNAKILRSHLARMGWDTSGLEL